MNLLDEIYGAFDAAKLVPQDLRDPECKKACDNLTKLMWKILGTNFLGAKISKAEYIDAFEKTKNFPHLNSRIYELAVFYDMKLNLQIGADPYAALNEYDSILGLPPPSKPNLLLKGCIHYKNSGIRNAQYYFLKANQEYITGSIVSSFFQYSRSISPFNCKDLITKHENNNQCSYESFKPGGGGWWILCSADSKYILRFLLNYVNSIENMSMDLGIHLHWIDNSDTYDERVAVEDVIKNAKAILNERFEITRENAPGFKDIRSFFANARYLMASEIMKHKKGLIITDIDYQLINDPKDFLDWCETVDIGLQIKDKNSINSFFPWLKVLAGTVVIKNNEIGHAFLSLYSKIFKESYIPWGFNWGLDQNILCNIYDDLNDIWNIGNSLKLKNPFSVPYSIKVK